MSGDGSLGRTVPCPGPPFNARIASIWKTNTASLTAQDGSVSLTKSPKLLEHLRTMLDRDLNDPADKVRFMLPQYNAVPY